MDIIIKASSRTASTPCWAEIKRVNGQMSNPQDPKMVVGLTDEQQLAYRTAWRHVASNEINSALFVLRACFDWVKFEWSKTEAR